MQRDQAYHNLRNLLLQEFQNKQLVATPAAVEDFVRLAAAKGLFLDDLIRMAESGMTGRQIAATVMSAEPPQRTRGGFPIP